jgi:diguanylate cyclase (GGDEF)-like protein
MGVMRTPNRPPSPLSSPPSLTDGRIIRLLYQRPLPHEWVYPISSLLLTALVFLGLLLLRGEDPLRPQTWLSSAVSAGNSPLVILPLVTTFAWTIFGAMVGRKEDRLLERSTTDALTSVGNRRLFDEQLPEEIARARRAKLPLSLLVIDLDHLKLINDLHGHAAGDSALRLVGRALRESCRSRDLVARFGGDEFVILAPGIGMVGARSLAGRLVEAVSRVSASELWTLSPLNVSIGFADIATVGSNPADLFGAADGALYVAKSGDRGRVVGATPSWRRSAGLPLSTRTLGH